VSSRTIARRRFTFSAVTRSKTFAPRVSKERETCAPLPWSPKFTLAVLIVSPVSSARFFTSSGVFVARPLCGSTDFW